MINKILNYPFSTCLDTYSSIKNMLIDNEVADPRITIHNSYNKLFSWSTSVYTYILLQALSKVSVGRFTYAKYAYSGDNIGDEIDRDLQSLKTNTGPKTICVASIAESRFNSGPVNRAILRHGRMNNKVNEQIKELNKNFLGCALINENPIIFVNKDAQYIFKLQACILLVAYKLINKVPVDNVDTLFKKLIIAFKDPDTTTEDYKDIYKEYMFGLPEYTINKENQFLNMIKRITDARIEKYKNFVSNSRNNLQVCLENLAKAQKRYEEDTITYNSILNSNDNNLEDQIKEMSDLLSRSKVIKDYDTEYPYIHFTVNQPLYMNDPEKWKEIEKNSIPDIKTRALLHKVFVDEKYQLYTECEIGLNLESYSVSRYTDSRDIVKFGNAIPHPHISGYNCFGQHTNIIGQLIAQGNYAQAIEQAIEAASGINWADSPVINKLNSYLENRANEPCFFDPETQKFFSSNEWRYEPIETAITDTTNTYN